MKRTQLITNISNSPTIWTFGTKEFLHFWILHVIKRVKTCFQNRMSFFDKLLIKNVYIRMKIFIIIIYNLNHWNLKKCTNLILQKLLADLSFNSEYQISTLGENKVSNRLNFFYTRIATLLYCLQSRMMRLNQQKGKKLQLTATNNLIESL